jgi:polysaccharide export outer membrane protein
MTSTRLPIHRPLVVLMLSLAGCVSTGEYVWVDALPGKALLPEEWYVIEPGDVLSIKVFGQEGMSSKVKVRSDGRISLPLIKDQLASGMTPDTLARMLEADLKAFVINPAVTVSVEEAHVAQVSVLGEVARPGVYKLEAGTNLVTTLALAGGITPFASRSGIYVVRQIPGSSGTSSVRALRIRFSYNALLRAEGRAVLFQVRDGDVLVVE